MEDAQQNHHSSSHAESTNSTGTVAISKDDDATTPHLETSFISDVASDSGNASGNSVKSEEIVSEPDTLSATPSHSATNNGLVTNSVFVPKVKKKGVIETV